MLKSVTKQGFFNFKLLTIWLVFYIQKPYTSSIKYLERTGFQPIGNLP